MPKKPRLQVTKESETGRNQIFVDTKTNQEMSRTETVKRINNGDYPDYHVRKINNVDTPVSNPNKSDSDNLG